MPRPSAAAPPSISAVPDGASTLCAVVHFEDFDVEVGVERLGRFAYQDGEQVDAEAHVARLDDRGMARGGGDLRLVVAREARGADDVDDARLRGELGDAEGHGRRGEIEHTVGRGEDGQGIGGNRHAARADPSERAGVGADLRRVGPLDRAGQRHALGLGNDADERPPHAPCGADDRQLHLVHAVSPSPSPRV